MLCTKPVKLPRGLKAYARKGLKETHFFNCWSQNHVEGPLRQKLIDCCEYKGKNRKTTVLMHVVTDGVDMHSDGYAKSCYMFPAIMHKHWFFDYEGDAYRVQKKLKVGMRYRFNDHNRHGLSNSLGIFRSVIFTVHFEDQ